MEEYKTSALVIDNRCLIINYANSRIANVITEV